MVCIVPQIKESYDSLKPHNFRQDYFCFHSHFKLILIVNGLQIDTSTNSCPYFCVKLQSLRGSDIQEEESV